MRREDEKKRRAEGELAAETEAKEKEKHSLCQFITNLCCLFFYLHPIWLLCLQSTFNSTDKKQGAYL